MKTKLRFFLFLTLAFLLIASVVSCGESYTQEDLDAAYEAGHAEGYDAGSHAGYKVGYGEGYDTGYEDGYEDGLSHAIDTPTKDELKVHYIDVGQGDSILVELGETEILIDGGGKSPGVVEYLSDYVDGAIEAMVATHPHADHIGGLIAVLDIFQVEEIWLNGDTSTSGTYSEFMSAVNSEGVQVYEARRGDTIEIGELTFKVLHPVNLDDTTNNNSIVLSLSYGETDFLFTGDAEEEAEASIVASGLIVQADILKVGHHGSRTASSKAFLAQVQPEAAIYMAGVGNRYGHPHVETILALQAIGAEIYGTDTSGTILITTDGKSYEVHTEK